MSVSKACVLRGAGRGGYLEWNLCRGCIHAKGVTPLSLLTGAAAAAVAAAARGEGGRGGGYVILAASVLSVPSVCISCLLPKRKTYLLACLLFLLVASIPGP